MRRRGPQLRRPMRQPRMRKMKYPGRRGRDSLFMVSDSDRASATN